MSRIAGSKNKPKSISEQIEGRDKNIYPSVFSPVVIPGPIENIPTKDERAKPREEKIRYDAIFGIRAFRTGRWQGLWELVKIDNDGKRTVLTDANSRGMVITMLNRQVMRITVG